MSDIVERLRASQNIRHLADADEITRLRERLAEADEANRRVSDENQRIRQSIKEYLSNLARVTNDMLREMYVKESGDE